MMLEGAIFIAECYNEHARMDSSLWEVKILLQMGEAPNYHFQAIQLTKYFVIINTERIRDISLAVSMNCI